MDLKARLGLAVLAAAPALLLAAPAGAALAAGLAPAASVQTACDVTTSGTTIMLARDCDTASTLTVPAGFTVDGAGHAITAHDPGPGAFFQGPVLTNAGDSMLLENLTVRGTGFAGDCDNANPLYGVLFNNASGSMTNVDVLDITSLTACPAVSGIGVTAANGHQTVTIIKAAVTDFQRNALLATGDATVNVADSTFGPPDLTAPDPGRLAQATVQYGSVAPLGGTGGTFVGNTVIGAAGNASADMLIDNAADLTVGDDNFGGAGAGISVNQSTGITVVYNHIARTATPPGLADTQGYGAMSDDGSRSQITLTCNTFQGWNDNLGNLVQPPCITTASLPNGTVGDKYPATLGAYTENCCPDLTWTVTAGSLPPGITLHPGGTFTGVPAKAGTYTFTTQVQDTSCGASTRQFTVTIEGDQSTPAPATPTPVRQPPPRRRQPPPRRRQPPPRRRQPPPRRRTTRFRLTPRTPCRPSRRPPACRPACPLTRSQSRARTGPRRLSSRAR